MTLQSARRVGNIILLMTATAWLTAKPDWEPLLVFLGIAGAVLGGEFLSDKNFDTSRGRKGERPRNLSKSKGRGTPISSKSSNIPTVGNNAQRGWAVIAADSLKVELRSIWHKRRQLILFMPSLAILFWIGLALINQVQENIEKEVAKRLSLQEESLKELRTSNQRLNEYVESLSILTVSQFSQLCKARDGIYNYALKTCTSPDGTIERATLFVAD